MDGLSWLNLGLLLCEGINKILSRDSDYIVDVAV